MEITKIREKMRNLPTIPVGRVARDGEIIEENEEDCHFKITKEMMIATPIYALSVSGPAEKRMTIIKKFKDFLGEPFSQPTELSQMPGITFAMWRAANLKL